LQPDTLAARIRSIYLFLSSLVLSCLILLLRFLRLLCPKRILPAFNGFKRKPFQHAVNHGEVALKMPSFGLMNTQNVCTMIVCKFSYQFSVSFSASIDAFLATSRHDVNSFLKDSLCVRPIFVRCITLRIRIISNQKKLVDGRLLQGKYIPFSSYYRSGVSENQMFSTQRAQ
jgi:hypothetical protein